MQRRRTFRWIVLLTRMWAEGVSFFPLRAPVAPSLFGVVLSCTDLNTAGWGCRARQVPNTVHSTVAAGPRGCNLVAFSPDGSMLASVCEGKLKFAVRVRPPPRERLVLLGSPAQPVCKAVAGDKTVSSGSTG